MAALLPARSPGDAENHSHGVLRRAVNGPRMQVFCAGNRNSRASCRRPRSMALLRAPFVNMSFNRGSLSINAPGKGVRSLIVANSLAAVPCTRRDPLTYEHRTALIAGPIHLALFEEPCARARGSRESKRPGTWMCRACQSASGHSPGSRRVRATVVHGEVSSERGDGPHLVNDGHGYG